MPTPEEYAKALGGQYFDPRSVTPDQYYWPNQQDVDMSKKYDSMYGSPHAPYATPGAAYLSTAPIESVGPWKTASALAPAGTTSALNTPADADRIRAEGTASERSAMAKLGWDPGLSVSTPPTDTRVGYGGMYKPRSNVSWYRQDNPSAAMHESMHRGIQMLDKAGKLPSDFNRREEEILVRALMNKAYGDVEWKQGYPPGTGINKNNDDYFQLNMGKLGRKEPIVEQMEKIAAEEIARKHPRGPR